MSEWVNGWMSEWVNEWMGEWVNGWMGEWVNGWVSGWMSEWVNQWMSEWVNGWVNGWMSEWVNEWMGEWVNRWMNGWVNEWVSERVRVSHWFEQLTTWVLQGSSVTTLCNQGKCDSLVRIVLGFGRDDSERHFAFFARRNQILTLKSRLIYRVAILWGKPWHFLETGQCDANRVKQYGLNQSLVRSPESVMIPTIQ